MTISFYTPTLIELANKINQFGELNLSDQEITSLPENIGDLQNIKYLYLSNNNLENLPDSIGNCDSLIRLSLQNNKLRVLPESIGRLQNLVSLHLDHNNLESLPSSIVDCKSLELLTITENKFNRLFDLIVVLSKINGLLLGGFPELSVPNKASPKKLTLQDTQYDIVIINPTCEGRGDYELAKKIETIASNFYKVLTIPLQKKDQYKEEPLQKKILANRFIITPYNIISPRRIQEIIQNNFILSKETKVLLIDEMDSRQNYSINEYRQNLRQMKIDEVYETKLGFSKNSIGYLSLTPFECSAIQQRARTELEKLLPIEDSAHYYLSYLNSTKKILAMQVFIINTLQELQENPSSINYVCSIGTTSSSNTIISLCNAAYQTKQPLEHFQLAEKFSTMNVMLIDPNNKKIFQEELQTIGTGTIPINIIFMTTLGIPKDTWHNFIAIAKSGMMTGDHSLSDYLSIKQAMPFYETQNWKLPLKEAFLREAEEFKDANFKKYVNTRFVVDTPFSTQAEFVEDTMLEGTTQSDFQEFGRLLAGKTANETCLEKIHHLMR